MQLLCPACRSPIRAEDISVDTGIAKCHRCNEVINLFRALGLPNPEPLAPRQKPVACPKRMIVDDANPNTWAVRWRWLQPTTYFVLFWCVGWDAFLVVWYSLAISGGIWIMALFATLHLAVGIGVTYYVIASFLNQTFLTLDPSSLTIRHAPLPWAGNQQIPTHDIRQLYCRPAPGKADMKHQQAYELCVLLKSGPDLPLVSFHSLNEPRYLEQQIEAHLRLPPEPVPGECP